MEKEELTDMRNHIERKVSWTQFWAIVGSITTAGILVLGLFYSEIQSLRKDVSSNNVEFAKIQTQLSQIQSDLAELKLTLKDHSR